MPAPEIIHQLVDKFEENREAYRSGKYNEAQLRQEFLDKFFEALGWDIYNRNGYSPEYRDVVIEDSLAIEGTSKSPDYTFKIGKERKFYVEAKKPSVDIQYGIHPAYQMKRYAWNAHLPLSILTDFEEFAIYNCKNKPSPTDSAATGRDKFYKYTEYVEKWDEIASIFSRDAVWKGSFDRFAESSKGKKGTTEVDDAFLEDIEKWRKLLAYNIALRNPKVEDDRQLNYAVQMTIDRIIFLRICEDRRIEPEEQLKNISKNIGIYNQLIELFQRADIKYNSGLFHFNKEKGNDDPADTFTPGLKIDDKVLKGIINDIYYPCPYIFKEIPVEILGQVYEQFLGKVIRLTAGHQAKIEEKPEVRKAGGVYYTPKYIVDYIVQNTVGKLLEGKTPVEAETLKIVDPACGSGSFLLGAYQHLLDWYMKWYTENDPEKWTKGKNPVLVQANGGGWKLTTAKKKQILVNNIHGVDIDAQAVEVTKLSLLLKVLEEESGQLSLGLERVLPDLSRNIQCGNSLIGWDYFEGQLVVDELERRRVNPFDWHSAFPHVFAKGGFDAVIGNPPYVFGRDWKALKISDNEKSYFRSTYSGSIYQLDMFSIFMELASRIIKLFGFVGLIVPNVWLTNIYSAIMRKLILNQSNNLIILKPSGNVFDKVSVNTIVYSYQKVNNPSDLFFIESSDNKYNQLPNKRTFQISEYMDGIKPISTSINNNFIDRVISNSKPLKFYANITRGVHPYRIGGFGKSAFGNHRQVQRDVDERPYNSKVKKEGYRGFIYGKDLKRFTPPEPKEYIFYGNWLAEPRKPTFFEGTRVYSRKILGGKLVVTVEKQDSISDQQVYISCPKNIIPSASFLAGIMGSKFISFYIRSYYDEVDDAFPQIKVSQLSCLPIPNFNPHNHDQMVALVERMLELHKRTPTTPQEQEQVKREIQSTDRQIDKLVYELYDLTDEEIKIVEGE
jgi:type I restriction-modification system DNA methylase subunit